MEVPRYWRLGSVNMGFVGQEVVPMKDNENEKKPFFRYPGGTISLMGTYEEIWKRFETKGFKPEVTGKILFNLFGAVASEATVSFEKIVNSQSELVGSEVRKEDRSEVKLGVNRLPRKISGKTLFSAGADN
jgi:hypothetical protein